MQAAHGVFRRRIVIAPKHVAPTVITRFLSLVKNPLKNVNRNGPNRTRSIRSHSARINTKTMPRLGGTLRPLNALTSAQSIQPGPNAACVTTPTPAALARVECTAAPECGPAHRHLQ
jgi:hypothetical protein